MLPQFQAVCFKAGEEVAEVLGQADRTRRDFERTAEEKLPDEQEFEQPADPRLAIDRIIEMISSARARKRGRQLAPDHAVARATKAAEDPADHRLGAAQVPRKVGS